LAQLKSNGETLAASSSWSAASVADLGF